MKSLVNHIKRFGAKGLAESLSHIELTEEETRRPWQHKDAMMRKLSNANEVDIPTLFEGLIGSIRTTCGSDSDWDETRRLIQSAEMKTRLGIKLEEAEINASSFQMLTAAKLFTTMEATYTLTPAVHEALFGNFNSPYATYNHVIPSDAPEVEFVPEGGNYPEKSLSDRWCRTRAHKFGARISLTRETMITDRTGQVVEQAQGLAASAKYREDQLAAYAWQDTTNAALFPNDPNEVSAGSYFPEGTRCALYRTAVGSTKANYEYSVNMGSTNYLLQWDSIATLLRLLRQMTNYKGQYIDVLGGQPLKLVVPFGIEQKARLLAALGASTEIRGQGGNTSTGTGTEMSIVNVPDYLKNMGVSTLQVICWPLLTTSGTASQSVWYLAGNSQKQFRKHVRWGVEFDRATQAQLGGEDFRRDVLMSVRAGFNSGFNAVDDKFVIKSNA